GPDGKQWQQLGESIYFGASAHHLRDNALRGDPDLGWVGTYKDRTATREQINGTSPARLSTRAGNTWTAATFGVFAVRVGAQESRNADFDSFRATLAP